MKDRYKIQVCKEHGLPEHFCARCGNGPGASIDLPDDGWCATHDKPEALCLECMLGVRSLDPGADRLTRRLGPPL